MIPVYLVSSTRSCVSSPNIKYPCVNAFSACLQSRDVQIQTAAIKILSEIFRLALISIANLNDYSCILERLTLRTV